MHTKKRQTTETNVLHTKKNKPKKTTAPMNHVIAKISQTAQDPTGRTDNNYHTNTLAYYH